MARSKKRRKKQGREKTAKKARPSASLSMKKTMPSRPTKLSSKSTAPTVTQRASSEPQLSSPQAHRIFSIELESIAGETTIGDLIVSFPRTRDVLLKHGLRFDVEEAGYLYMTINVFSAMHGLESGNLIRELQSALKETPAQSLAQVPRQVATPPTA